jgi:hypothetical protein
MNKMKFSTYAIDFDDTITRGTKFPEIGELNPHADRVIRRIKENGGEICIWTCRTGEHEEKVKKFLADHDIPYDSFNEILPSERQYWGEGGRKVFAHCYIDDKGIYAQMNGGIDWLQIESYIFNEIPHWSTQFKTQCLLCGDTEPCDCDYELFKK